jgi:anti-sigma regulatory factor (Ser/Thr protein kinase)
VTALTEGEPRIDAGFRHEAFFYAGIDEFLAWAVPFVSEGIDAGDAILVAVDELKIRRMQAELGERAGAVDFRVMPAIGRNPAVIISAWVQFVEEHASDGRGLRGIGEPVWAERNSAELEECERHERLLNVAFAHGRPWVLVCPYDLATLPSVAIEGARRSHPVVVRHGEAEQSPDFAGLDACRSHAGELPPPVAPSYATQFASAAAIGEVRRACEIEAERSGIAADRIPDISLALNEVATNSLRYGGGAGVVRMWSDEHGFVCEVSDNGVVTDPLVGRLAPRLFENGGRGLWLANQLCDLVQIRSGAEGTVVRLRIWR